MASDSIAHLALGLMGYWLRALGGGHLGILWVDMCRPGLQIGTPSKKHFP